MNGNFQSRVLRTYADLESIRETWTNWQHHPHADLDFFRTIARIRPEVICPYVIALYRDDILETLLVGRLEHGYVSLNLGYWRACQIPIRSLTIVHGGLLGNRSRQNCAALIREAQECLIREKAHVMWLHFVPVGSVMHDLIGQAPMFCRDYFSDSRPHWVMKLPKDVEVVYERMSTGARRNRRYEARRLAREFTSIRVECYEHAADLDRVFEEAESIACRTYQRGLGVGFAANQENRERFRLESERGCFRGYFLYFGEKPVAFFLGTLYKNVLYDHYTAYDPDYSKYSPGTYLLFQVFEKACHDGVDAVDFGFGDAWYKAQFGTEKIDEATVGLFARNLRGITMNLVRLPFYVLDRIGKKAAANIDFLKDIKKKWRGRAQRRADSGGPMDSNASGDPPQDTGTNL